MSSSLSKGKGSLAEELAAALARQKRGSGETDLGCATASTSGKGREGIEWSTSWEPTSDLPDALDKETAAQEYIQNVIKSENEEKFAKQQLIRDYSIIPEKEITPEVKRDFRILRLRGVMDPKRFYKGSDESKIPKRFQWGTVIEGPTEFYSSRMTKKERKQTFTQEIMGDSAITTYRKRKFKDMQKEAQKSATRQGKQAKRKPRKKSLHKGYKG